MIELQIFMFKISYEIWKCKITPNAYNEKIYKISKEQYFQYFFYITCQVKQFSIFTLLIKFSRI